MRSSGQVLLVALAWLTSIIPASADDEVSNVSHVVAGPYGRCYAKSVPAHVYDPEGVPRQQGVTRIYRVAEPEDILVYVYDWFGQRLFLKCGPADDIMVARAGPWHRGHDAQADHLAIAFYRGGALLKSYSTLDISGGEKTTDGGIPRYKNVSASVSHYTVFETAPEMIKVTTLEGYVYSENWLIRATTIDGQELTFDMETGEVRYLPE